MSTSMLHATRSMVDFAAVASAAPIAPRLRSPAGGRLRSWLTRKSRARMAAGARVLLARHVTSQRGDLLSLDCLRGTPESRLARLRGATTGTVDTVVSIGALADAADVVGLLAEVKRVLRPGGRLLFVEPVSAPAGTHLRRLQRALDRGWRVLAGTANAARDLWNDLKAARFGHLRFDHAWVAGLAGMPVPTIVGEAMLSPAPRQAPVRPARQADAGAPVLAWSQPAFAFFGS